MTVELKLQKYLYRKKNKLDISLLKGKSKDIIETIKENVPMNFLISILAKQIRILSDSDYWCKIHIRVYKTHFYGREIWPKFEFFFYWTQIQGGFTVEKVDNQFKVNNYKFKPIVEKINGKLERLLRVKMKSVH